MKINQLLANYQINICQGSDFKIESFGPFPASHLPETRFISSSEREASPQGESPNGLSYLLKPQK